MALVACGAATSENNSGAAGSGSAAGPSTGTGGGSVGAAGSGPAAGAGTGTGAAPGTAGAGGIDLPPPGVCTPGIPVTTQIPLMLNRQYANVVRDLLGVTTIDNAPVADGLVGDFTGAMTAPAWAQYQAVAAKIATQVMSGANKTKFINCDPAAAGCLKTTIETFGRKAFRRPLTPDEVASFQTLSSTTPAGTPAEVAEATLNAFLVSPSFLMIPELNTEADTATPGAIKLSQQEVATRLSFMLWGSVPDDALNAAVDANQLGTKEQILTQATRMIGVREKTGAFISTFHREWSQVNNSSAHWYKGTHDTAKYPSWTPAMATANQAELDAFFEEVAYTNGSFHELLTSNVAFVNKDNASLYGLDPASYGAALTKVALTGANPRPGFLTRGGFLGSYASYDSTSPILRGSFMAVWLLSINIPPPDPENTKKTVSGTFPTQRAYVEALTETDATCKGCHSVFNPLGYVMENYDAIGKWQTVDPRGGGAVNATATVNVGNGATSKEIKSPTELMEEIAKAPKAQELYAQAWVAFATGRQPNGNDQCVVNDLKTKLAGNNYPILSLLADLTQTDAFRSRVRGAL